MASTNASTSCERKYQCKLCPKRFTTSSVLTKHVRVHTGEKPFQCKTCLRSFSQLTNMKRHQKIHIKDQTFKCKYCDERFSQLAHLLKHESTHKIQDLKDYPQDSRLTYLLLSLRNQNAVSSSLDENSNQDENIRTSIQSSSKNLTSFSNVQIPSSNFKENDILTSDQALSLDTDDFQQQIQMGFVNNPQNIDGKTSETFFHNSNNTIVVSEESEESVSFDQQISRNSSEVQPSRIKLELSTNSVKYFDNPLERKNSSFDIDLRAASDELKVIDIKPDLSVLSSTNNRNRINTVDHLNVALQLSTSSQDNFADSEKRNYNDIFANEPVSTENIQYFKSESELCFDNNNLAQGVQATTNDFIQDSASGLKSFNNSQLNLSLPTASSSFHFENSRVYIDSLNSQNEEMKRNSSNVDFEQLNISHSLSSGKFEVDEDETLVIRKQIKTDMSHLDCKDDEDNDDDIKFEFQSVSLASHKVQRKLEDEQMNQKENSFEQEKNRVLYLDTKVRMAQNGHIESNDKLCRDLESGDIILLSPGSVLQSTSKANNPLSHSVDNVDKPSISCNFEDANNQDVVITNCESSLEKSLEEVIRHESQFDRCGKIAVRDVSENPSIVIESVFSMNNKVKHGSSAREELCENSLLSSTVVKHSGISDKKKLRNEVEVINLEDFSPKEMRNDEQHNWSIPLVDIEEITPQKLDAESDFKIQLAETEDDTSKESNLASSKIWDINYLKTNSSEETVLEEIPSFQNITNNDAKNISNPIVSLERSSCITCSWCNEKFSNKSCLLSHLCARSESFHSAKSPISEEVDQNPFKPCGQFPEEACETAENCANLTGSHQNQREKFICKYCKKHFSQASILLKHIETHMGKKAFVCDLCQQPFSQLTNLNPVKKKFQFRNKMLHCQFCQKTFPHSFQLLNHLKCHARSIQRSINVLEDKIRQKRRGKVVLKNSKKMNMKSLKLRKSTSQKYLKMKPKSIQLSKKNVNQANSSNCLIPVVHLKRSHSDPEFNEISQENDENLNAQDVCNEKMKKQLFSQQCFNSVEVSGNLTRDTSSFVEKTNANISRTYTQEEEEVEAIEDVNQIVFPFSVKTSEDQDKVTTDSGFGPEQFRSENNSLHILENSQSEEADKSIQNVLVPILPSELVSNIEYIKSLPQKDMLPIPSSSSSSVLQKSYPRDHTSNPDKTLLEIDLGSMQSGFDSTNMPTRVNFHNTSVDENLSEVVFVTSNSADQISSSNAPVKSGQFHCKICNKSFNRKCILIKHLRTHTGEKPYKCDFCPRLFSQLHNLNRHKKTHLPFGLFPCKFCPFRFSRISELNAHTKKMHISMKRHSCTFCNMRFSSSSVLKRHIRTHTGEKPFVCELCNRAFSQATNLTRHMKVHVPARTFRCRYCSNTFKQYWHFKRHLITHIQLGKTSNEDAFIRKARRQHCIQQIHSRRTKPSKSNDFICKLSDSKEYRIARRIQSFEDKIESLGSKRDSLQLTASYEPATISDILKANSFQDSSDSQPYEGTVPIITGTPEILAINGHLLSNSNYNLHRVKSESNDNHDLFINSDGKFLREADDANDENQSKNLLSDNYEMIEESLENEDATTLGNPVNVKLEPEDVDIEKQSESIPENSNSDSLCRQNVSAVSFKKYPCRYCNKFFHHSQVLYRHLRSQHKSEMMMTSTCQLCNASFPDSDTLNKHRKTCSQLLLPYFCNLCKEKFPNSSELNWHRQRKHSGGVNHYFCRYCTKVFSKNNALTEHIRTHTGEKPFVCDVCQRPFSQATNLKRHQKIHARNGSFVCKYCNASFSWLSHLSRHLHMHAVEEDS